MGPMRGLPQAVALAGIEVQRAQTALGRHRRGHRFCLRAVEGLARREGAQIRTGVEVTAIRTARPEVLEPA